MQKKLIKNFRDFVVIDFETTGLDAEKNEIIEVSALKYMDRCFVDSYITLIKPKNKIPYYITQINGITNEMVEASPEIEVVLPRLIDFIGQHVIVAHNASFDMKFLISNGKRLGYEIKNHFIDTLALSRKTFPGLSNHKLITVARHIGILEEGFHRAEFDTRATAEILLRCTEESC